MEAKEHEYENAEDHCNESDEETGGVREERFEEKLVALLGVLVGGVFGLGFVVVEDIVGYTEASDAQNHHRQVEDKPEEETRE